MYTYDCVFSVKGGNCHDVATLAAARLLCVCSCSDIQRANQRPAWEETNPPSAGATPSVFREHRFTDCC